MPPTLSSVQVQDRTVGFSNTAPLWTTTVSALTTTVCAAVDDSSLPTTSTAFSRAFSTTYASCTRSRERARASHQEMDTTTPGSGRNLNGSTSAAYRACEPPPVHVFGKPTWKHVKRDLQLLQDLNPSRRL
jgi:hypothetical protein